MLDTMQYNPHHDKHVHSVVPLQVKTTPLPYGYIFSMTPQVILIQTIQTSSIICYLFFHCQIINFHVLFRSSTQLHLKFPLKQNKNSTMRK